MTRGEIRGAIYGFLANADGLPLQTIDRAIDRGVWSVYRRMRARKHFGGVREKFLPLVAGQDEVDPGPEVESISKVFRQDMGGERVWQLHPDREEEAGRIYSDSPALEYEPLANGRLRLLQRPTANSTDPKRDGLRLLFRPQPVPLPSDDSEPDLPRATHEAVVVEAVNWLSLSDGALVSDPARFEGLRGRVSHELDQYLAPTFEDSNTEPPDTWGFYSMEGSI